MGNNNEVVQVLRHEASGQPVEESIIPHQPHGGGADDEQGPLPWVACSNADGLHARLPTVTHPSCQFFFKFIFFLFRD